MAQQTINNGQSGLNVRDAINENFTELYGGILVPIKLPAVAANAQKVVSGNSMINSISIFKAGGVPTLNIGTTANGGELLPTTAIAGSNKIQADLYCAEDTTLYITIAGGSVNIRMDVVNNYY